MDGNRQERERGHREILIEQQCWFHDADFVQLKYVHAIRQR